MCTVIAMVALGVGGSLTPFGDVSVVGLDGAEATTAVDIAPLGVSLMGALLLAHFFLRSLRAAGAVVAPTELVARVGSVLALFLAMLAGLAWVGHNVVTIDGERLGVGKGIEEGIDEGLGKGVDGLPGDLRLWLLGVAAALMMLFAGVLTAARTPWVGAAGQHTGRPGAGGVLRFAGWCGVRLGGVTAVGVPLLVWLTEVDADASLSVLGFDAFGAGIELHGRLGSAVPLGAAWGFGAGAAGALMACATGAAGGRASPLASTPAPGSGPMSVSVSARASVPDSSWATATASAAAAAPAASPSTQAPAPAPAPAAAEAPDPTSPAAGPYRPSAPQRPPNPDTNPYLRPPGDVSGAPTVSGPLVPPPRPRPRSGGWPPPPPPPPPPPKPPPRRPR